MLVLSALLLMSAAPARKPQLEIERFHSTVTLQDSGSLLVRETIDAHFIGRWSEFARTVSIPTYGLQATITVRGVRTGAGFSLEHQLSRVGTSFTIHVHLGDATDARRSIILEYEVADVVHGDEFRWTLDGSYWSRPVHDVSAEIILPSSLQGASVEYSTAPRRATLPTELLPDDRIERSFGEFAAGERLTLRVRWHPRPIEPAMDDHVPVRQLEASFAQKWLLPFGSPRNAWLLVFPAGAVLLGSAMLRLFGPRGAPRSIASRAQPPDEMGPAEFGVLVGGSNYGRIVAGMLADLGRRGFVAVEQRSRGTLWKTGDYEISRLDPGPPETQLAKYERDVLPARGNSRWASARFAADAVPTAPFYALLRERGYYSRDPNTVRWNWLAVAVCGVPPFSSVLLLEKSDVVPTVVAVVCATLIVALFLWRIKPRTSEGDRAFVEALGFAKFMRETPFTECRNRLDACAVFERCLPYALVVALEERLYQSFRAAWGSGPELVWYRGSDGGPTAPTAATLTKLGKSIGGYNWSPFLFGLARAYLFNIES